MTEGRLPVAELLAEAGDGAFLRSIAELDSYEAFRQVGCVLGRRWSVWEPGKGSEWPAAPLVSGGTCGSHQDASFRAGRLGVVGPIFGDGLLNPVELRSLTTPARHDAPDGDACRTSSFRSRLASGARLPVPARW